MKARGNRQESSALVSVLGIISIVSIVCGMLGYTATQQMRSSQITRDMLKARAIAESGLNVAYHAVRKDFTKARTYQAQATFDGGTYTVRSVPLNGNGTGNRAKFVSEGVCGLGRATVAADLENRPLINLLENDSDFFQLWYDLISGGNMHLSGDFNADVCLIFSNGTIDLGGSHSVTALIIASAKTIAAKKLPDGVTLMPNQPMQDVVNAALLNAIQVFKTYAEQNGAVYANAEDIPAVPPGGVAYCTGSDKGWSGSGTGCFIFEGMFNSRHVNVTSVDGYPSLVVLSPSSIQFNAGTYLYGAVLLPNSSLKFDGHAVIYGPLLVGQTISGRGTADLFAGEGQGFNLPPILADNVVISAWH